MSKKLLFMDVDGTLTDGKLCISANGELFKSFNVKDGYGINVICKENGIIPVIITARMSEIVVKRATEIGITEIYQGVSDKTICMHKIVEKYGLCKENCAYIGDDIPDIACMELCQYSGCPADAVKQVKEKSKYICSETGGNGAVREFIDWLVSNKF